jgi:hypothetical protein
MARHKYSWLFIIWVIVGLIIAWTHAYITVVVLKLAVTVALAVFLWPLLLLGVSLHVT